MICKSLRIKVLHRFKSKLNLNNIEVIATGSLKRTDKAPNTYRNRVLIRYDIYEERCAHT